MTVPIGTYNNNKHIWMMLLVPQLIPGNYLKCQQCHDRNKNPK